MSKKKGSPPQRFGGPPSGPARPGGQTPQGPGGQQQVRPPVPQPKPTLARTEPVGAMSAPRPEKEKSGCGASLTFPVVVIILIAVAVGVTWLDMSMNPYRGLLVKSTTGKQVSMYAGTIFTSTQVSGEYVKIGTAVSTAISVTSVANPVAGVDQVYLPVCLSADFDRCKSGEAPVRYARSSELARIDGEAWPSNVPLPRTLNQAIAEKDAAEENAKAYQTGAQVFLVVVIGLVFAYVWVKRPKWRLWMVLGVDAIASVIIAWLFEGTPEIKATWAVVTFLALFATEVVVIQRLEAAEESKLFQAREASRQLLQQLENAENDRVVGAALKSLRERYEMAVANQQYLELRQRESTRGTPWLEPKPVRKPDFLTEPLPPERTNPLAIYLYRMTRISQRERAESELPNPFWGDRQESN